MIIQNTFFIIVNDVHVLEWRSSFLVGISSSSWGNPFWHENGDLWGLFEVLSNCKETPLMIFVERFHSWCHWKSQTLMAANMLFKFQNKENNDNFNKNRWNATYNLNMNVLRDTLCLPRKRVFVKTNCWKFTKSRFWRNCIC